VNAVNKLVTEQGVDGRRLHCSVRHFPPLPILHKAHIPTIISQACIRRLRSKVSEVFRTISTSAQEAPAAAKVCSRRGTQDLRRRARQHRHSKELADLTANHLKEGKGNVLSLSAITRTRWSLASPSRNHVVNPDAVFLPSIIRRRRC